MSFNRYPTYKKSEAGWMFDVPEHWKLLPCRGFVDERTEKNEDASCQSYLSLMANVGVIPYEEKGDIGNKKPDDLSKCKIVHQGDFVINSMNYGIGSYGVSAYEGVCSPVYIVLRPKSEVVEPGFAFRVFEDKSFQAYAQSFGNGILAHRCSIGWDDLKGIAIGIPPAEEQKSILNFLDHETAKIDALIAEQERLIELLQEKRQAVISHAVTKGLNPNAPMKDSGVVWLGEVPEHWIVGKLRYYSKLDTGSTPDRQRPEYWNGDIPWVKTGEVRYEDIYATEEKITEMALQETACDLLPPGTLLMALYGQGVTRGRVGMLMSSASCNQACAAITPSTKIFNRYLELYLTNAYSHLRSLGNETTQQNLNLEFVGNLELLIPPLAEQEVIFKNTQQKIKQLEDLHLQASDAIALLKERRHALISAAVTGQIDVRGFAHKEEGEV